LPGGDISKVTQTSPSSKDSPTWGSIFKSVAATGLNLGANVLMQKAGISSNAETTSPGNMNGAQSEGNQPIVVYDPSASGGENLSNIGNYLNNLVSGLFSKQSNEQPNYSGYMIIGVVVLVIILLIGRK
jgi:hypothetical protein